MSASGPAAGSGWTAAPVSTAEAARVQGEIDVVESFVGFTRAAQVAVDSGTVSMSVEQVDSLLRELDRLQGRLERQARRVAGHAEEWSTVHWGRTRSARAMKQAFRDQASDQPGGAQRYLLDFAGKIEIIRTWLVEARDQVLESDAQAADAFRALDLGPETW